MFLSHSVRVEDGTYEYSCHRCVRIQACMILQRRGDIAHSIDCEVNAPKYVSAASMALYSKWKAIESQTDQSLQAGTIREACFSLHNCAACRSLFYSYAVIDVRLQEKDAMAVSSCCHSLDRTHNLKNLFMLHAQVSGQFLPYETFRSGMEGSAPRDELFKSPLCMPQHYCEPLRVAVELLLNNTRHLSCLSENQDYLRGRMYDSGMGSSLHVAAQDAIVASYLNIPYSLAASEGFNWADQRDCDPPTVSCYYSPFGAACNGRVVLNETASPQVTQPAKIFTREGTKYMESSSEIQVDMDGALSALVQATLERSSCSNDVRCEECRSYFQSDGAVGKKLFGRAASVAFFQRFLSPQLLELIRRDVSNLLIPRPVMSIHVRRGDKHKEMRLLDLEDYLHFAIPISLAFGVKNIFLSTEDPTIVENAFMNFSSFNWIVTEDERRNPNFEEFMRANKTAEFILAMKNLYAAADCDFLLGTRASNWCRLIDETKRFDGLGGTYYIDAHGRIQNSSSYADW